MFLFFLTLIPFNFLGRVVHGWMVHRWYVVCGVIFGKMLDWEPTFLVFLLIFNWVGISLVGLSIDLKVQAWFLVCGGFIFCGILDCETTFFLEGNARPKTAPGPKNGPRSQKTCIFSNFSSTFVIVAEVFYGDNYWSTIITSKNTSKNLSFCCFWDKKCIKMSSLFTLLRFFDKLFYEITFWHCKKLLLILCKGKNLFLFLFTI